jgi:hypothetical protein
MERDYLIKLYYEENKTPTEIEKITGLSFFYYMKKYDLKLKPTFNISIEELKKLYYDDKLSYSQIEKKLKLKRGRIYSWFKKYEIEPRNQSSCMEGRKFSEEHKEKIAKSNSKPHTEERCINISKSKKGKTIISEEHKEKIRQKFIGLRVGDKHPMWKGGLSMIRNRLRQTYEYKNWRNLVYKRDEFICQICGSIGGKLNCHHIEMFSDIVKEYELKEYDDYINCDKLWDLNNGITLCKNCHISIKGKEKELEQNFKKIINENYEKNKII